MNIEIELGTKCNCHCIYCEQGNNPSNASITDLPLKKVADIIRRGREEGADTLHLQGGEPTLHQDFFGILKEAKDHGIKHITLFTNARMLAIKEFTKKMLAGGVDKIVLSFQGPDAAVHDMITEAPGSFEQAIRGVRNLLELGMDFNKVTNSTVILKQNLESIPLIPKSLAKEGVTYFHFINFIPYDNVFANQDCMEEMTRITKIIHPMLGSSKTFSINVEGIPFCLMQGKEKFMAENYEVKIKTDRVNRKTVDKDDLRIKDRSKPDSCQACIKYAVCKGIHRNYLKRYGQKEFIPIP